jgi:hypothetical protein
MRLTRALKVMRLREEQTIKSQTARRMRVKIHETREVNGVANVFRTVEGQKWNGRRVNDVAESKGRLNRCVLPRRVSSPNESSTVCIQISN